MSGLASCEAALSHRLWLHAVSHFGFVKQPTSCMLDEKFISEHVG